MSAIPPAQPTRWDKFGEWTLLLAIGLCVARAMMMETIRDPFPVVPKQMLVRGPGAVTTTILDFLSFLPAILVCVRAILDESFSLRWSKSVGLLGLLGALAVGSVFWSVDRFAAAVASGRLLAGAAMVWALVQLVRDWRAFRIVTASLAGLLAVIFVHCLIYRLVDMPEMQRNWELNREQILAERGWEPDSFQAQQFGRKVLAGEFMGFTASPNSLASLMVLIAVVLMGDLAQRVRDKKGPGAWAAPGLMLLAAGWVILGARSRTAGATPVLAMILIFLGWRLRDVLARHRKVCFAGGLAALLLFWAAVIGHGLHHGTLLHRSLTFRWHYWVASMRLLRDHLLAGVGWNNFADYYLQYRLPIAPEEIQDPHNLFVRFATELGLIGLAVALGWLAAAAWELTRPGLTTPTEEERLPLQLAEQPMRIVSPFLWVGGISLVLVLAGVVDTGVDPGFWLVDGVLRRGMYAAALVGVSAWLAVSNLAKPRLDDSPAPLTLLAAVVALGVFVFHNFIDFAMFEAGPWYVMMLVLGSAIGMRAALAEPAQSQEAQSSRPGLLALGLVSVVALAFGVAVAFPVVAGEEAAKRADVALVAEQFPTSIQGYGEAYEASLWLHDDEYLMRKSRAQTYGGNSPDELRQTLDAVLAVNPRRIEAHMTRAELAMRAGKVPEKVVADLTWGLELNPTDIDLRMRAADILATLHRGPQAVEQYRKALALNEELPQDEVKRLSQARLDEIKGKMAEIEGSAGGR